MSLSIFSHSAHPPSKSQIMEALGRSYIQWIDLVQYCRDHYAPLNETWRNFGKSSGWTLLLTHKDRTVLCLFPGNGCFYVLFIVDDIIIQNIKKENFPS